jgi:hypothetical protein
MQNFMSLKQFRLFLFTLFMVVSGLAAALPKEVSDVFTSLGADVALLAAAAAVLFGLIRGGTSVLKIAGKFFGAAGA